MKKILFFFIALLALISCQQNADWENLEVGYVRLNVETLTSTVTRALDKENYNPKQLAVVIVDESGSTIKQTDDYTVWDNMTLELPVGTYTVTASSNGFDGNEAGFDIPYYSGSKTFTVGANTQQTVNLTCTLATVKVTVNFTDRFKAAFTTASVNVSSALVGISDLQFVMGTASVAAYFPVGNLTATISATSDKGTFQSAKTFENVLARDHYVLTYDVSATGGAQITIKADENGNTYTYTLNMGDLQQVVLTPASQQSLLANTYSNRTTLEGTVAGVENFDVANAYFEYKTAEATDYIRVSASESATRATSDAHHLIAVVEGLTPETDYEYHLIYLDTEDTYTSKEADFTTEKQEQLPFANFDSWCMDGKMAFPCDEDTYTATGSWWDTSNKGATSISTSNTVGDASKVYTSGGSSARLSSIFAGILSFGKFAAASLYAGKFNKLIGTSGAMLDWGRPFTSRPKALHGYVQYATDKVNYVGNGTPASAGMVKNQSLDMFSAYVALVHIDQPNANGTAITVDNTDMSTFPDWTTDPRVVAYAALPDADCVGTNGQWKELNLELDYYKTDVKPTHIIVVFSSSKYGDYFTGSTKSVLYIDDLELVY